MKRIPPPERKRRRWPDFAALFGGLLFISGFLEAVFAHSAVLLTVFVAYLLLAALLFHFLDS